MSKPKKKYVYVTGGKGGIGKSTTAVALADYYSLTGKVLIIDTDPLNPDSAAPFKDGADESIVAIRAQIRSEDSSGQVDASGLMDTLNEADKTDADTIIVDAPAGDYMLLMAAGTTMVDSCRLMGTECIIVWLVDATDRTAINVLSETWETIKAADKIVIVKNYRDSDNFDLFDNSKTMEPIMAAPNVVSMILPKIAQRLKEHLRLERMSWKKLVTDTPIGNRVEAQRVRAVIKQKFEESGL